MHHIRPGSIRAGTARIAIRLERPTARPEAINLSPTEPGVRPRRGDLPKPTAPARSSPGRGCPPNRGGTAAAR
jgi:hypothetical protein